MPVKKTAKSKTRRKKKTSVDGREIIYPNYAFQICSSNEDSKLPDDVKAEPLTVDQAKKLLGWQRPPEGATFEDDQWLFKDFDGITVACSNNDRNRPFNFPNAKQWMFEILAGNWKLNGEPLIIGETGQTLDSQHRLIGFVLAVEEWNKNPDNYPYWKNEPSLECTIFFGVSEDQDTINTINTGKSRSLSDAIFASSVFVNIPKKEMKVLSRITDYAIRLLWERLGFRSYSLLPRRTHSESIDFLNRHHTILDSVAYIHSMPSQGLVSSGYAAGLHYLMSCSTTVPENDKGTGYRQVDFPSENEIVFETIEKANQFWDLLCIRSERLEEVWKAIAKVSDGESGGSPSERVAIIVKAWNLFSKNKKVTAKGLRLKYKTLDDGFKRLIEFPQIGVGLDIGEEN